VGDAALDATPKVYAVVRIAPDAATVTVQVGVWQPAWNIVQPIGRGTAPPTCAELLSPLTRDRLPRCTWPSIAQPLAAQIARLCARTSRACDRLLRCRRSSTPAPTRRTRRSRPLGRNSSQPHLGPSATRFGRKRTMWQPRRDDSAMDSPLPVARPWTPPDTEVDSSPRSDYFSDPFRPPSHCSAHVATRWPHTPALMERCDSPTDDYLQQRPKPVERLTEPAPYTPTKTPGYGHTHAQGPLRYPYTPDSSRMVRRSTELPSSPPAWDDFSDHSSSPVQNALSSCIAHFENLIHSHEPDEDQMEFIVRQFEAMTSFLSAPASQAWNIDHHVFSGQEQSAGAGLGIADADGVRRARLDHISREAHEAYVTEVGTYIASVKKYVEDLKMRMDEVKTLNSIQLDVITDLRRQMKTVRRDLRSTLDMRDDVKMVEEELGRLAVAEGHKDSTEFGLDSWMTLVDEDNAPARVDFNEDEDAKDKQPSTSAGPRRKLITIIRKPEKKSFWASIGEALDLFGQDLLEQ
jgi:hypothetical protein